MKDVLASLEQGMLHRNYEDWPIALALLQLVLMTVESIQYHAAKLPYHQSHNNSAEPPRPPHLAPTNHINAVDEAVSTLLAFYATCYAGCHARLWPDWQGETKTLEAHQCLSPEDTFVHRVRAASQRAEAEGYLAQKAGGKGGNGGGRDGDGYYGGMEGCFDRLVARALMLGRT